MLKGRLRLRVAIARGHLRTFGTTPAERLSGLAPARKHAVMRALCSTAAKFVKEGETRYYIILLL